MDGTAEVVRKKCGEIYILPNDQFALICYFCGQCSVALEDMRAHLIEHFPISPKHIKNEDSISFVSENVTIEGDIEDMKVFAEIQPTDGEFGPLPERCDFLKVQTISEKENSKGEQPIGICEVLSNTRNEAEDTHQSNEEIIPTKQNKRRSPRSNTKNFGHEVQEKVKATNTGKRSHRCPLCSKTYAQKGNLKTHVNAVHKNIRYECSVCCKKFATKHYLNKHENIHTRKRLYQCYLCSKNFTALSNLSAHISALHG